jgi:hypothetical protein
MSMDKSRCGATVYKRTDAPAIKRALYERSSYPAYTYKYMYKRKYKENTQLLKLVMLSEKKILNRDNELVLKSEQNSK